LRLTSYLTCLTLAFYTSRRPPGPPLFPYTTLFRSGQVGGDGQRVVVGGAATELARSFQRPVDRALAGGLIVEVLGEHVEGFRDRSEEHTSELQSRENLVCRLLLEKKKKKAINTMQL